MDGTREGDLPPTGGTSFSVPDEAGVGMELSVDRLLNGDED